MTLFTILLNLIDEFNAPYVFLIIDHYVAPFYAGDPSVAIYDGAEYPFLGDDVVFTQESVSPDISVNYVIMAQQSVCFIDPAAVYQGNDPAGRYLFASVFNRVDHLNFKASDLAVFKSIGIASSHVSEREVKSEDQIGNAHVIEIPDELISFHFNQRHVESQNVGIVNSCLINIFKLLV